MCKNEVPMDVDFMLNDTFEVTINYDPAIHRSSTGYSTERTKVEAVSRGRSGGR